MDERKPEYEFVPPLDTKYECPICKMVLVDPVQTECGHRYCKACINKWLREKGGPKCPLCNERIGPDQLFPDNFAKREIGALKVKCLRAKKGCREIIEFKYIEEHIKNTCDYGVTACPLGCKMAVLRKDVEKHQTTECPQRIVQCPKCNMTYKQISHADHEKQCPGREVKCEDCGQKVKHEKLPYHHKHECEVHVNDCFFHRFGCTVKGNKPRMKEHWRDDVVDHLELVAKQVLEGSSEKGVSQITAGMAAMGTEHSLSLQLSSTNERGGGATSQLTEPYTSGYGSTSDVQNTYSTSSASGTPDVFNSFGVDRPNSYPFSRGATRGRHPQHPPHHGDIDQGPHPYSAPPQPVSNEVLRLKEEVGALKKEVSSRDRRLRHHEETISRLEKQMTEFESRHCNGVYLWRIHDFAKKRREAMAGNPTVIHSPGFYSSFYGYKLCIRANLNGVEAGTGKFVSLFVHFMRGDYDDVLEWPFHGQITITVMDQNDHCESRRHISETLVTKPHLAAFQKPTSNRNHKGFGYIEFAPINDIENSSYIKNDVLVIKAVVESKN